MDVGGGGGGGGGGAGPVQQVLDQIIIHAVEHSAAIVKIQDALHNLVQTVFLQLPPTST